MSGKTKIETRGEAWYKNFLGPGPDANPYSLSDKSGGVLKPANELDARSQEHDLGYYLKGASGVKGAAMDINVADADLSLAKGALNIFGRGVLMGKDRITNSRIISNSEMILSLPTGVLFMGISGYKIPLLRMQEGYNGFINDWNAAWMSGIGIH